MTLTLQQKCDIANALRTEADGFRKTAQKLCEALGVTVLQPVVALQFTAKAKELEALAWDIGEAESVKIERKENQK